MNCCRALLVLLCVAAIADRSLASDKRSVLVETGPKKADQAYFSKDGRYLLLRERSAYRLWNTKAEATIIAFDGPADSSIVAVSDDLKFALIRRWDAPRRNAYELWHLRIGGRRAALTLADAQNDVVAAFAPNGRHLALAAGSRISVWDTVTGALVKEFGSSCDARSVQNRLRTLGFGGTADGILGPVTVDAIERFQISRSLPSIGRLTDQVCEALGLSKVAHGNDIVAIAFTPDGGGIITAARTDDSDYAYGWSIVSWNWLAGTQLHAFGKFDIYLSDIDVSPDGCTLIVSADTLRTFDLTSGIEVMTRLYSAPAFGKVHDVIANPNVVVATSGGENLLWDWKTGADVRELTSRRVMDAAVDPQSGNLLLCEEDGDVQEIGLSDGKIVRSMSHRLHALYVAAFSSDGRYLVASTWGGLFIWDLTQGTVRPSRALLGTGRFIENFISTSAWLFTGVGAGSDATAVAVNVKGVVTRWSLESGAVMGYFTLPIPEGRYPSLSLAGAYVVVATGERGLHLRHRDNGAILRTFAADEEITAAVISDDARMIAAAGATGGVRLFDAATGDEITTLSAPCEEGLCTAGLPTRIKKLGFARGGEYLYSVHEDRSPQVWHVPSRQRIHSYHYRPSSSAPAVAGLESDPFSTAMDAAFAPDAARLAIAYSNGGIAIFDVTSGRELVRTSPAHEWLNSVVWSPDGKYIATTSNENVLRLRNGADGQEVATLRTFEKDEWLLLAEDGRYNGSRRALRSLRVAADGLFRPLRDGERERPAPEAFVFSSGEPPADKGPRIVSPPRPGTPVLGRYGRKFAVVIGISRYRHLGDRPASPGSLANLQFADRDAREFEAFLRDTRLSGGGWEIKTLLNHEATERAVDDALSRVLTEANQNDIVVIFFSGHGRGHHIREQDVYLLTHDFEPDNPRSGYSYTTLQHMISDSRADHVIAFIDACRSGEIGFAKGGASPAGSFSQEFLRLQAQARPNKLIFSSGRDTQASHEDPQARLGLFTAYLLRGLRGEAPDQRHPEYIDIGELRDYVREQVVRYCTTHKKTMQVPSLWEADGMTYEHFPLAIRR